MKSILTKALVEATLLVTTHTLAAKTFASFWKAVSPKLTEGVHYMEAHGLEGLQADRTFLEIITHRDAQIDRIVQSCLKEFLHSDVLALIENVTRIEAGITERLEQINAWKLASLSAPATSLMPLVKTRALLERRIVRERRAIERDRAKEQLLKEETLKRLAADGLPLTAQQLEGLLHTAEGADIARTMAVAQHVNAIKTQLSDLLAQPDSGPEQVKSFAGFLMMSLRVYITALDRAIEAIEKHYLVRLTEIMNEAHTHMLAADALAQQSAAHAAGAATNIELNARTIELAQLYAEHLRSRLAELQRIRADMVVHYELACNTFRTVKTGSELLQIIESSQNDLSAIFDFEAPTIEAFYDTKLRREFDAITARLKSRH